MTFRLDWAWAGRSGSVDGVDVATVERVGLPGTWEPRLVATVETVLQGPDGPLDIMAITSEGHHVTTGTASIYEDGALVLSGRWAAATWGERGEPVTLRLAASPGEDTARLPGSTTVGRVAEEVAGRIAAMGRSPLRVTLATAARRVQGAYYPVVYGAPGDADHPGSRALQVDTTSAAQRIMIAGHPVEASTVTIWGPQAAAADNRITSDAGITVRHDTDDDGNAYAYVSGPDLSNVKLADDGEYYASWTGGPGLPGGAGDVVVWLLASSTLRVDIDAWQAVRGALNAYQLAGYIDQPVAPSEYLRAVVLPMLPVSVAMGPSGLTPALWPWALTPPVAARRIVAGPGFTRDGDVSYVSVEPEPGVLVAYGQDAQSQATTQAVTVDPATSLAAAVAQGLTPAGDPEPVETPAVWDPATAWRMAYTRQRAAGVPPRAIPYSVDPMTWTRDALPVGSAWRLTDAALGLSDVPVMVAEVERTATEARVVLHLYDDPSAAPG